MSLNNFTLATQKNYLKPDLHKRRICLNSDRANASADALTQK